MRGLDNLKEHLFLALIVLLLVGCSTSPVSVDSDKAFAIAFLRAVPDSGVTQRAMLATLRMDGYIIGTNLTVLGGDPEEAYAEEDAARAIVEEWRNEGVDLIVAISTTGARTATEVAPDINTLFLANDPIATGLVEDAERPEGSLTGVTFRVPADRTLSLIRRAVPGTGAIGLIYPPSDPAAVAHHDEVVTASEALDIPILVEPFDDSDQLKDGVARLAEQGVDALLLSTSPTATRLLDEFREAAALADLPVATNTPLAPWAILSLYPDAEEIGRQLGRQAARLLAGSAPASIPVEDPRQLVLELNAVTASEHGIHLPEDLMREADQVTTP